MLNALMMFPRVPFPLKDGGAIAMYNLIKGINQTKDVSLTLFFLNTSKHYVDHAEINKHFGVFGDVHIIDIKNDITVPGAVKNLFSKQSYIISRFINEGIASKLTRILKGQKFDVIHVDGLQVAHYVRVIRENVSEDTKVILRQHNVEQLIWERLAGESGRVKKR